MSDVMQRVVAVDLASADSRTVTVVLGQVAAERRRLDGVEVACHQRLAVLAGDDPSMSPEHIAATATRTSLHRAGRAAERAATATRFSELGAALAAGAVSGEHVDVMTAARRGLTPAQRARLAGHDSSLTAQASASTPDEFRREVAKLVRQIEADDGTAKLERHRRARRLRTWLDKATGMIRVSGEFDPETGLALVEKLNNTVDSLFHAKAPADCPVDPLARQDFLRALALLHLVDGGSGPGRVEISIVIDWDTITSGWHAGSRVDCGIDGVELPLDTIRRMALFADIIPVLLDHDGVVLKLGRTRRLANRDQRRALRAMYRHCAMPGCRRPVRHCEPHHTDDWHPGPDGVGGLTDIDKLVPICKHHHDVIHHRGWKLSLSANRCLTITKPDGTTMTTGPPNEQWL